jgi:hypothetical protein
VDDQEEMQMNRFTYTATPLLKVLCAAGFAAAMAFSSSVFAQGSSGPYGGGARTFGQVKQFVYDRDQLAKSGQMFKIEGHCQSACTLFLKLKNVCIDPNAELLFHAGVRPQSTALMLASYNGKLRSYLTANHYMDTPEFHTISGLEMIQRFGYRRCPGT